MIITKAYLQAELVNATEARDKHLAQMNVHIGQVALLKHLLELADMPEPPAKEPAKPK